MATGAQGTVAGVVEQETAALEGAGPGRAGGAKVQQVQERDLVWRRRGRSWALALRRVFNTAAAPTRLWSGDVEARRPARPRLRHPFGRGGFGNELDVVDGTGRRSASTASWARASSSPPSPASWSPMCPAGPSSVPVAGAYDQTLIGYSAGSWRVVSQQYVPDAAALAQHHGPFRDAAAVPAS